MRSREEKRSGLDRRRFALVRLAPQGIEWRWAFEQRASAPSEDTIYGFDTTPSEDDWETFFNIHIRE